LGYYKYTNFAFDILNSITGADYHLEKIVLPLAISFFTFQQIAWLVDQYRNEAPESSFLEYICAVTFFPHLIAGPIVQYHDLIPQFQGRNAFSPHWDSIAKGLFLIGCGVFKKIVIADTLAVYVRFAFDEAPSLSLLSAWFAVFSYTMQIYFDFSGYCDIAIGSAHLLGIRLPDNFRSPYKSSSIREFWQRWHMTLGSFLTRYLYIPMGGSRKGLARTSLNVLLVMVLSGLWHGAGFGFILWGTAHGIAMVVQRLWNAAGRTLPKLFATILTFLFVASAWVLFRATDLETAGKLYRGLLGHDGITLPLTFQSLLPSSWDIAYLRTAEIFGFEASELRPLFWALLAAFICVYACREAGQIWDSVMQRKSRFIYVLIFGAALLLLASFIKMIAIPYTEFIYFNF
jgi:Predicted membrane protein involved in D-alanine export